MDTPALYNTLSAYKDTHKTVLNLAESLTDEQLHWKPQGYPLSIGFHLWHLARESDYLKAAILTHYPGLGLDVGEAIEIWQREELAQRWGFPEDLHATVGTGLTDEAAANLPVPAKEELLDYLRRAYLAIEEFIELLDARYASSENLDEELKQKVQNVRRNLLVFMTHDNRHLGMMECLKGLLTGRGTATA